MDLKIFWAAFGAIFLAELADKTQLAGMAMVAKFGKPLSVWLGSVCAYIIVTAISVSLGKVLFRYVRPEIIRYFGAGVFILIGALIFLNKV